MCSLENTNGVSICSKSIITIGSKSTNLLRKLRTNDNQSELCTLQEAIESLAKRNIIYIKNKSKKKKNEGECCYVENLKSLSNTDGDKSFGAEPLNGEGDAAGDTSDSSIRFKNPHFAPTNDTVLGFLIHC